MLRKNILKKRVWNRDSQMKKHQENLFKKKKSQTNKGNDNRKEPGTYEMEKEQW